MNMLDARLITHPHSQQRLTAALDTKCARIDFRTHHNADCDGEPQAQLSHPPASLPGGYSVGVPPDPIPNSAVKPDCANGTIAQAMEE